MHPLLAYGIGVLLGALACAFFYGYSERYQKIAGAVGGGLVVLGGIVLAFLVAGPYGERIKHAWPLIGVAFAIKLGGYNLGISAQIPSGGFSSARTDSMIGFVIALIILALSFPAITRA